MTGKALTIFFQRTWQEFLRDRCLEKAGALSFVTVLSFVPVMIVSLTFVSAYFPESKILDEVQTFLVDILFPDSAAVVWHSPAQEGSPESTTARPVNLNETVSGFLKEAVNQVGQNWKGGPTIVLLLLLIITVSMFRTIEATLNQIWRVERGRTLLRKITSFWTVMTLGPLLLVLSIRAASLLYQWVPYLGKPLGWTVHLISLWVILFFLYRLVPHTKVPMRHAAVGAVCATVLVYLSKIGFVLYMRYMPTLPAIYGPVAAVAFFLVWVWVAWVGVLYGAEVVVCRQYGSTDDKKSSTALSLKGFNEYQALRIMIDVCSRFTGGEVSEPGKAIEVERSSANGYAPEIVEQLVSARLLIRSDDEDEVLVPARPPEKITVGDILAATGFNFLRMPPNPEPEHADAIRGIFTQLRSPSDELARRMTLNQFLCTNKTKTT